MIVLNLWPIIPLVFLANAKPPKTGLRGEELETNLAAFKEGISETPQEFLENRRKSASRQGKLESSRVPDFSTMVQEGTEIVGGIAPERKVKYRRGYMMMGPIDEMNDLNEFIAQSKKAIDKLNKLRGKLRGKKTREQLEMNISEDERKK